LVSAVGPPESVVSLDWAEASVAWEDVSCSCAAVASAVARVSPFLTVCPTVTATVVTGQVSDPDEELLLPVEPPVPDVVAEELTMSGLAPNLKPYTVLAEIVPVATDWALTVPTVTVCVMYCELADPAKLGPTMASATAPTPTRIKAIAANLVFIRLRLLSLQ
jgi:hypothetical protein